MIVLSYRDDLGILRRELLGLRMSRNKLGELIDRMNDQIPMADENNKLALTSKIQECQTKLEEILKIIKNKEIQEDVLDPSRPERRVREKEEIKSLGFTIVDHGETQYNSRYEPQMSRSSLLKTLTNFGLGSKIPNYRHHIIRLMDNFYVAVEDYKVLTFRYNDQYYNQYNGNPPKIDLLKRVKT